MFEFLSWISVLLYKTWSHWSTRISNVWQKILLKQYVNYLRWVKFWKLFLRNIKSPKRKLRCFFIYNRKTILNYFLKCCIFPQTLELSKQETAQKKHYVSISTVCFTNLDTCITVWDMLTDMENWKIATKETNTHMDKKTNRIPLANTLSPRFWNIYSRIHNVIYITQ